MKSEKYPSNCSRSCCAHCRTRSLRGWEEHGPFGLMCEFSQRPTVISRAPSLSTNFAVIFTIGCTCSLCICLLCVRGEKTSHYWCATSCRNLRGERTSTLTLFRKRRCKPSKNGIGQET